MMEMFQVLIFDCGGVMHLSKLIDFTNCINLQSGEERVKEEGEVGAESASHSQGMSEKTPFLRWEARNSMACVPGSYVRRREISPSIRTTGVIHLSPCEPCTHPAWMAFTFSAHLSLLLRLSFSKNYFLIYPCPFCIHNMISTKSSILLFTARCSPQL